MKKNDFYFLLKLFVGWRLILFFFLFLAIRTIPLQQNFLGGRMANYLANPWLWAWVNFDGEHYLAIAREGYRALTYFFFPVYPMIVKALAIVGGFGRPDFLATVGLLISNISFLIGLVGLYKLARLDYSEKSAKLTILLLLLFPTSFFFGSFYTESLFLALSVWSFYFARRGNYLVAGILGGVSTATRIVGLALIPALVLEASKTGKKDILQKTVGILLVPLGLLIYMYYLKLATGNPFEFLSTITVFGEQRSSEIVLLPQVFFRYFFKILPNLNYSSWPSVFTTFLEIATATVFFVLAIISFLKIRLSYAVYFLIAYLIPTFSGSFSSFPRYAVILFPAFILGASLINSRPKILRGLISIILFITLAIACMLFVRGYWIS